MAFNEVHLWPPWQCKHNVKCAKLKLELRVYLPVSLDTPVSFFHFILLKRENKLVKDHGDEIS